MGGFVYPVDPIIIGLEYGHGLSRPVFRIWENALTPADVPLTERPWYLACQWKKENSSYTRKREIAIISLRDYDRLKNQPKKLAEHVHYIVDMTKWKTPKADENELRAI